MLETNLEKNKNLHNVLKNAVSHRDTYYEEGLITYILNNIDKEILNDNNTAIPDVNYFKTHSNFWGLVCAQYYYADMAITDIEYFKKYSTEDKYLKLHSQAVEQQEKFKNIKSKWKELLIQADIVVEDNPTYYLSHISQGIKHTLNYKDWLALSHPKEWIVCFTYDEEKWKITDRAEQLFVKELINDTYSYNINYLKKEEYNQVIDLVAKHQESVKKEYKQSFSNSQLIADDEFEIKWLEKVLRSSSMKKLIEEGSVDKMSQLFGQSSCRAIINKCKQKQTIESHPEMLSNLLGVASPESWINSYSSGKNFNLLSFFNAKFKRAYGRSLTSELRMKLRYPQSEKYVLEELEYLKPALLTARIPENEKLTFWTKVLQTENIELIKKVAQCIPLPDIENPNSDNFYYSFEKTKIKDFGPYQNYTFKDIYKAGKYEELQSKIPNKTEEVKRKIKI